MADKDTLANALVNPKRILAKREKDAGLDDAGKAGRDAGDLPSPEGFQMSQAKFSGYPDGKKKSTTPPPEMLKNRK